MHEYGDFVRLETFQRLLVAVAFEFVEARVVRNREPSRGEKDGNVVGALFHFGRSFAASQARQKV